MVHLYIYEEKKTKLTKIPNSREKFKTEVPYKMAKSKAQTNNCGNIYDLVQAFSYVESCGMVL